MIIMMSMKMKALIVHRKKIRKYLKKTLKTKKLKKRRIRREKKKWKSLSNFLAKR